MSRKEVAMTRSELKNPLSQFTTQELEREILSRQKCQFNRLTCTRKAEDWIIKPFNYQRDPVCFNCKQDILAIYRDKDHE